MFLFSMDRRGRLKKRRFQTHPELIDHLMRQHQYVRMTTPIRIVQLMQTRKSTFGTRWVATKETIWIL